MYKFRKIYRVISRAKYSLNLFVNLGVKSYSKQIHLDSPIKTSSLSWELLVHKLTYKLSRKLLYLSR